MQRNNTQLTTTQKKNSGGFTIIEVMIFLAVTTFLFVAVVATFGGQQGRTQFVQGAREMESRVQDIINDVSTGYYPSRSDYICTSNGITRPTFSTATSAEQGSNSGCIFIGKVIQFNVAGTNSEEYRVFSVAGKRLSGGNDVTSLSDALPTAIAPVGGSSDPPDATESAKYPNGLTVAKVTYGGTSTPADALGIFSSFGAEDFINGGLKSGSVKSSVSVINTGGALSPVAMAQFINDTPEFIPASTTSPATGVTICMVSATSNQIAKLKIGGDTGSQGTNLEILDGGAGDC